MLAVTGQVTHSPGRIGYASDSCRITGYQSADMEEVIEDTVFTDTLTS